MIAASAAIILATSCSGHDEEQAVGQGPVPITLTATVVDEPEATRTVGTIPQEGQFPKHTTFYAFFPSGVSIGYDTSSCGTVFTTNGSGGTHPSRQPYFNDDATEITVSAYYPYSADGKQVTNTTASFSVETDQTSVANYKASDLLYATATVTKENPTAELNFTHQLSKIIVKVKTAFIPEATVSVTLNNTYTSTALNNGQPVNIPNPFNPATIIDFSGKRLVTDTLMVVGGKFYTAEAWRQRSTESALDIPITEALETDSTTADSAKVVPEKPKPKVKPEAPKTPAVHVVRQGDTLYGIARRYHTTVAKICKLNGIDEDAILSLGQKFKIPK